MKGVRQRIAVAAGRTPVRVRRTPRFEEASTPVKCVMDNCGHYCLMLPKSQRGFSLIEALVVIALLAVLAGLAAPSFDNMIRRYRVDTAREAFIASLNLARTEAIRLGQTVVVRRLSSTAAPDNCPAAPTSASDWSCGWRVFVDLNSNSTFESTDTELQVVHPSSRTSVTKADAVNTGHIFFNRFGSISQLSLNFRFTPVGSAGNETSLVCINAASRIRTVKGVTDSSTCN